METYIINGVPFQFDPLDLMNLELYSSESKRIRAIADRYNEAMQGGDYDEQLSLFIELTDATLDVFDLLLGEGATSKIFGDSRNAVFISDTFTSFMNDVSATIRAEHAKRQDSAVPAAVVPSNREQKRAEERAKRREEAQKRVERREAEPV